MMCTCIRSTAVYEQRVCCTSAIRLRDHSVLALSHRYVVYRIRIIREGTRSRARNGVRGRTRRYRMYSVHLILCRPGQRAVRILHIILLSQHETARQRPRSDPPRHWVWVSSCPHVRKFACSSNDTGEGPRPTCIGGSGADHPRDKQARGGAGPSKIQVPKQHSQRDRIDCNGKRSRCRQFIVAVLMNSGWHC